MVTKPLGPCFFLPEASLSLLYPIKTIDGYCMYLLMFLKGRRDYIAHHVGKTSFVSILIISALSQKYLSVGTSNLRALFPT